MYSGPGDRGVSRVAVVVVTSILVLSLVTVSLLSSAEAANAQAERDHTTLVETELSALHGSALRVAGSGAPETASVTLGARYPSYLFSRPAPATGSLTTRALGIEIANVEAVDPDAAEYLKSVGGSLSVDSSALVYEPHFSKDDGATTTAYESGVVYSKTPSGEFTLVSDGGFIDGNRITLVAVDADLATEGADPTQLSVRPVSAPSRALTVINTVDESIVIRVKTTLAEEQWDHILADQLASNGGFVTDYSYEPGESTNTLTVTLRQGEFYSLRLAMVGVGQHTPIETATPAYIVKQSGGDRWIPAGSKERLVVQVRDRFNNPVEGVIVKATYPTGELTPNNWPTDEDGLVEFEYSPGDIDQSVEVSVWFGDDPDDPVSSTTFTLVVGGEQREASTTA
ncbi:hypothetical protein [Haloarchaeobius sp. TZWWS8]|uniref:hypothetical protein n=1 Tax=Haloarchaeobius sp. TZWWS8 TaxID=3446121 RepID=UPI003EB75187